MLLLLLKMGPALAAGSWAPCGGVVATGETGAGLGCSCLQLICWLAERRVSPLPSLEQGCRHCTASHIYGSKAVISLDPRKPPGEIDGSPGQPLVTAA